MKLQDCLLCIGHSTKFSSSVIIHVDEKPSIDYKIKNWLPEKVKTLFIAESPSYCGSRSSKVNDTFFYNEAESIRFYGPPSPLLGPLSWNIFNLLGIEDNLSKQEKLKQFKKLGCFFTEAVKCRTERYDNRSLVNQTVKNCARYLESEIEDLQPDSLVILGQRSLFGLKMCKQFNGLIKSSSINELMKQSLKKPITINGTNLYFLPIPSWRKRTLLESFQTIFTTIKQNLK